MRTNVGVQGGLSEGQKRVRDLILRQMRDHQAALECDEDTTVGPVQDE
jgi:hypothetical protein